MFLLRAAGNGRMSTLQWGSDAMDARYLLELQLPIKQTKGRDRGQADSRQAEETRAWGGGKQPLPPEGSGSPLDAQHPSTPPDRTAGRAGRCTFGS